MSAKCYTVGLDLGMGADRTALAVLERRRVLPDDKPDQRQPAYALRHMLRFPPGTGFPAIVNAVVDLLRTPPLPGAWLLADYSGVSRAVLRLMEQNLLGRVKCSYSAIGLIAGHEVVSPPSGGFLVPKTELIGTVQILLQTRRLQVASDLPHAGLLVRELENYRPKVVLPTTEALLWRDGVHDDLIFAVALAAWGGERALMYEGRREKVYQ